MSYNKDRDGKIVSASQSFIDLASRTGNIDKGINIKGMTVSEIWGAGKGRDHQAHDEMTWRDGENTFIDAVVDSKNGKVIFLQYYCYKDTDLLVSDIKQYTPPFLSKIKSFDKKKKIFITQNNSVIRMHEIDKLIAYLNCDRISDAAKKVFRSLSAFEKQLRLTAQKFDYPNHKKMRQAILQSIAAGELVALTNL